MKIMHHKALRGVYLLDSFRSLKRDTKNAPNYDFGMKEMKLANLYSKYLPLNDGKSSYKADLMLFLSSSSFIFPSLLSSIFPEGDIKTV